MKCPACEWELLLKKHESYKDFFMCVNKNCSIISVIMTTTEKAGD